MGNAGVCDSLKKLFVGVAVLCCATLAGVDAEVDRHQTSDDFSRVLLDRVEVFVQYSQRVSHKEEIFDLIDHLKENGSFVQIAGDEERSRFALTQSAVEHVLACSLALRELDWLVGAIHTPMPTTPLCVTAGGDLSEGLLASSIAHDADKVFTVTSRASTMREYLKKGGELFVVYPRGGLERRSRQQQRVFQATLRNYRPRLHNCVLKKRRIDPEMIGATHLFCDREGNVYAFSIKGTQANDPQEQVEWGIWFGKISEPVIQDRVVAVLDYLQNNGGPDLWDRIHPTETK